MRMNATYGDLWAIHIDIQSNINKSPFLLAMFSHKIEEFYKHNKTRLDLVSEQQDALVKKYVQHDQELKPMKHIGSSGVAEYLFENDELKRLFIEERKRLMNTPVLLSV